MKPDLTDEETDALARLLRDTIDADNYPLRRASNVVEGILARYAQNPNPNCCHATSEHRNGYVVFVTSRERMIMKKLASCLVWAAIVAIAIPAWSQTSSMTGQSTQGNPANAGGPAKPGVPGLPGSKSGPTVTPSGTTLPEASRNSPSGDQSKVPGQPGGKSGPTVNPPSAPK